MPRADGAFQWVLCIAYPWVTNGIEEAAEVIGWDVRVIDGGGSIQGRTAAMGQAIALQPDGIVINSFDATEQQAALESVVSAEIPMVAWHSGPVIGCDAPIADTSSRMGPLTTSLL